MKPLSEVLEIVNHFRSTVPVDVKGLALALGASVTEEFLDESISGSLHRGQDGRFSIVVNAAHPPRRKRFTIAHELGHLVLHGHLIGEGIIDGKAYRADGPQRNPKIGARQETEANRFAANLLMPADTISELKSQGITSSRELAARFDVSEAAMEIRLSKV